MTKIWCRLKTGDTQYYYVEVDYEMAMSLCMTQGYEIKCNPPPNNKAGYYDEKEL